MAMLDLKEVKLKYPRKCKKCNRDLRVSWSVFFDPKTKDLYCKPCGDKLLRGQDTTSKVAKELPKQQSEAMKELVNMSILLVTTNELLATLDQRIAGLEYNLSEGFKKLKAKQETKKQ